MFHKVYKLRELFPVLAAKDIETLKKERHEYIQKHPYAAPEYWEPTLTAYCPDNSVEVDINRRRPTILICPGGGYEFCSDREAEPVALELLRMGYNVFVLRYECAPEIYPKALLEAAASVAFIRRNAEKFNVCEDKIAICGFSAGGHLAASLGVFWNEKFIAEKLGLKEGEDKPNALILGYPVITSGKFAHRGSINALLGENQSKELLEKMSLEKKVTKSTPPTFMWQTFADMCVPVENSMMFAKALKEHGIPFEYHVFQWGGHGLSVCNKNCANEEELINPHCENWVHLLKEWLDIQFK